MDCRGAGRFVRCGFGYGTFVMSARTRHVATHSPCCRATLFSRVFSAYSAAHFVPVLFTCCHAPWCRERGQMVSSSLHGAAHSMVPRPVCCRAPVFPRTRRSAAKLYAAAHPWCRAF